MGLFDGKFFDAFRGDAGDLAAAERRAEKHERKLAAANAHADSKRKELNLDPVETEVADAAEVQSNGNRAVADMRQVKRAMRKLQQRTAEAIQAQEEVNVATAEQLQNLTEVVRKQRKLLEKVVRHAREEKKKEKEGMGFMSDTVWAAINGIIKVINVSDEVRNPTFAAAAAALEAAVATDRWEENEQWLLIGATLCNTIAHWDMVEGLSSVMSSDSGSLLPGPGIGIGGTGNKVPGTLGV